MKPSSNVWQLLNTAADKVNDLRTARDFVCGYRPDAFQSIRQDRKTKEWIVGVYDARLSITEYGYHGKLQHAPQLLGKEFRYPGGETASKHHFAVEFAHQAWGSAARYIAALVEKGEE